MLNKSINTLKKRYHRPWSIPLVLKLNADVSEANFYPIVSGNFDSKVISHKKCEICIR